MYYFITDNGVQWFSYIIRVENKDFFQPIEQIEIPNAVTGDIIGNITCRELAFGNKQIGGDYFYGWSISKLEFDRIKRACELYPHVCEYNKILKL